jgi:hypothetical protein
VYRVFGGRASLAAEIWIEIEIEIEIEIDANSVHLPPWLEYVTAVTALLM